MQQNLSYSGASLEMATSLVRENGLDRARQIAVEGTTHANEHGDFYRLSVWREVKGILREWAEKPLSSNGILADQVSTATVDGSLTIPSLT
ncbi:MAG: hypothetical protein O3A85_14380 [Proteobacteria bacterium]|nr:hypothetical protein [Pseudomonadota bacterium]